MTVVRRGHDMRALNPWSNALRRQPGIEAFRYFPVIHAQLLVHIDQDNPSTGAPHDDCFVLASSTPGRLVHGTAVSVEAGNSPQKLSGNKDEYDVSQALGRGRQASLRS